jgi:hypothetical protein
MTALKDMLPTEIEIRYEGAEAAESVAVTWNDISDSEYAIGDFEIVGNLANGRTVKATVQVVNDKLIYFFDCAAADTEEKIDSSFYDTVKDELGKQIVNDVMDQAYTSDNKAGYTGNFTDDLGVKYASSDIWGHGFWARGNKNIDYAFDLDAGKYAVDLGFSEWWNTTRALKITVSTDDGEIATKDFTLKASDVTNQQTVEFELEKAAKVTVSVSKTGNPDGVLSWIAVIKTDLEKKADEPIVPAPNNPSTPSNPGTSGNSGSSGNAGTSAGPAVAPAQQTTTIVDAATPLAGKEVSAEKPKDTKLAKATQSAKTEKQESVEAEEDVETIADEEVPEAVAEQEKSSKTGFIIGILVAMAAIMAAIGAIVFSRKRKL